MTPTAPGRRMAGSALAALVALGTAVAGSATSGTDRPHRPNVIVVLTDDQHWDTLGLMPWLDGELRRPGSSWSVVPHAYANTPLCCPARAILLTGRYARHTGVLRNADGGALDEGATLATWLHDAGYRTALVGKYLNLYPFGGPAYVPPGWDRFVAKLNRDTSTVYRSFDVVDQGSLVHVGDAYATDWLADRAVDVVRTTPRDRPLFLLLAPSAPHPPWLPAARHDGDSADLPVSEPPSVAGALRGAPPWVRALPTPSAAQRAAWTDARRRAAETLLAVDDALRRVVEALGARLDDTVILVLSDNGYSFGEHRWEGKRCPYEACVRIPMAIRSPWEGADATLPLVSLVDLAPTILGLAGVSPTAPIDGERFDAWIAPRGTTPVPEPEHESVFLEWAGDDEIPAWTAVKTRDLKLIRYADGFEELYDIGGRIEPADPWETANRVADPRYGAALERLRAILDGYAGPAEDPG